MVEIKNVNRLVTINPIENNEEMQEASSSSGPQAHDQNVDQTISALKKQSTESRSVQELQGRMQSRALEDQLNRKLPGQNPGVLQYQQHQPGQIVPTNAQGQPLTRAQIAIDQFAEAADKGDIVKLRQLIAAGVDVNGKESSLGETALMQAARRGNIAVIDELMKHGARVDEKATNGQTALMQASMAVGGEKAVHHLIHQYKADVNVQDTAGRTALMMTAIGNSPKAMEELLNANAKTNMLDGDPSNNSQPGQNALMYAAERGNKECMELLMKAGVDVDMVSRKGKTAVYLAASRGHAEAIELLIKANANPNVPDPEKRTPLMIAASGGYHQAVKTLVANSAALDERDPADFTAVFEAVTNHHHESLKALLDAHADPNVPITIRKGWTPLMDAARDGDLKSVQLLIQAGAKQDLKNGDGETALTVAQNALKFRTDLSNDDRKNLSVIIQLLQTPSKTP